MFRKMIYILNCSLISFKFENYKKRALKRHGRSFLHHYIYRPYIIVIRKAEYKVHLSCVLHLQLGFDYLKKIKNKKNLALIGKQCPETIEYEYPTSLYRPTLF
jgi:hypothetical protein